MLIRERERERCRAGTTLIEVIVALFVVSTVGFSAMKVISTAFDNSRIIRDRLTAQYLAQEGIEIVEKKADTNLIRYNDSKCWNFDADNNSIPCDQNKRLSDYYRLSENIEGGQFLSSLDKMNAKLDLSKQLTSNEKYRLSIDQSKNQFYTYINNPAENQKTKFYRMIEISYEKIGNPLPSEDNKMIITSTVQWMRGGNKQELVLTDGIFNQ